MSFFNGDGVVIQVVAEEAISQYQAVKLGTVATNGQYVKKGTDKAGFGAALEDIASGASGRVQITGIAQMLAHDSSIAADNFLKVTSAARVDGTTTDLDNIIGKAMGAAGAQDDVIEVLLMQGTLAHT